MADKLAGSAIQDATITAAKLAANANPANAYIQANSAANLVAVYANGSIVYANSNVNFNNTATVNISVTSNTTNKFANIEFTVNTTSTGVVAAYGQANSAYAAANSSGKVHPFLLAGM